MKYDRHHLLEIILWPTEDGSFKKIINSLDRLKELGIYDDYKMCITIPRGLHTALHMANLTAETKTKMSNSSKGIKNGMFGRKHTDETRLKMSANSAWKGKTLSDETKLKISENHVGFIGGKHTSSAKKKISQALKGRTFSEEHKKKLSASMKGRIPWNKGKKLK